MVSASESDASTIMRETDQVGKFILKIVTALMPYFSSTLNLVRFCRRRLLRTCVGKNASAVTLASYVNKICIDRKLKSTEDCFESEK